MPVLPAALNPPTTRVGDPGRLRFGPLLGHALEGDGCGDGNQVQRERMTTSNAQPEPGGDEHDDGGRRSGAVGMFEAGDGKRGPGAATAPMSH
jgi:hypothetical protein